MKRNFMVMLMLSTALLAPVSLGSAAEMSLAQDFTLQDTQGNKVNLASFRAGQPTILFFWTTWCPFCREELKVLSTKYAELTKGGGKVIAVNIGEPAARVNSFIQKNPLAFSILLDSDSLVAYGYEIIGVPTYVVINKDGAIVFRDNYFPEAFEKLFIQ